ncbi:TetR/AcrR family transcriptional regulator [Mycobacterium yunnanensis]|uniref:TetR/AcrR family transcriptional regulator n=1 Tax=Mycobacterium yunnanensis TaxID=368477 RepID=A0A9X3BZU9_9MYCO|nr:TetR/AcrR family transcriptional regulator [Mycobacterium yunnanensis]MCV7419241.1 TetR/AcrR family transcriptional regulator [Mycobacterium yunnanensis]
MSTPPTRRRTASHEVSAALLRAAETVLDRDGSDGVTVRAVAEAAEVSPTSVYNRFRSKDGLTVALAVRTLARLGEIVDVPAGPEPRERLRQSCRNYRDFALRHPARYALIFGTGSPLEDQSSEAAESGRAVFTVLKGLIGDVAPELDDGELPEAAQTVWAALHGSVTIEQAGIGQTPDADATFEHMLDCLIQGVTAS